MTTRIKRLLAIFVALAAACVVAEVGLRLYAGFTLQARGVTHDRDLGWRMLPDITKTGNGWCDAKPAMTNAHGWRDKDHAHSRTAGQDRILAVGDSFTFGWKVDYGERFTERLETLLPDTEVVNLGACAYGPDQELLAYEIHGAKYGADIVVWELFVGNDLDDIRNGRASGWPKPYFRLRGGDLDLVRPKHSWLDRARVHSYLLEAILSAIQSGGSAKAKAPEWESGDPLILFQAVAKRMAKSVQSNGSKLLAVVAHPPRSAPDNRASTIVNALKAEGIEVLDLFEPLHPDPSAGDSEMFLSDGHWTAAGHDRVAGAIAAALRQRGWM